MMQIQNCTLEDFDFIMQSYVEATTYQKERYPVFWPDFDPEMVKDTIIQQYQWKMVEEGKIVCIWTTSFEDPLIWGEKNNDPSVYIHRIATQTKSRGQNLVQNIVEWARQYARNNHKQFVRMDTVGNNEKLIQHYTNCGFQFLGLSKLENTDGLPDHYNNATVALFELHV